MGGGAGGGAARKVAEASLEAGVAARAAVAAEVEWAAARVAARVGAWCSIAHRETQGAAVATVAAVSPHDSHPGASSRKGRVANEPRDG